MIRSTFLSLAAVVLVLATGTATAETWSTGMTYRYDGAGNIRQIGDERHVYDAAGRLVQSDLDGVTRTYTYDRYGNRQSCLQAGGTDCQGGIGINSASNRINGAAYDLTGNLQVFNGHTYSYDALNMQARDVSPAVTHEYIYTADDERIAVYTPTSGVWRWTLRDPSGKVLRELSSRNPPDGGTVGTASWTWNRDYVYRDGQLLASRQADLTTGAVTTYRYHLDHLGTPRRITDPSNTIVGQHNYVAFGPEASAGRVDEPNLSRLKYTGHERDGDLDYMHARYYDPMMGRFLSVDPGKDWDPKQPQSWNMYAYVRNNPVRFTDPTGKYVCRGDAAAGGCDTIQRGLDQMREAAAGLKNSDPRKAALQAVIKAYGKQGDATSKISTVWINPRNANGTPVLPSNVFGQAGKNGTMFVSLVNIAAKAGGNADKAFTMLGGTLTHEGKHMLQPAVVGFSGRASLLSLIFYERQAYSLQQGYYAGLGQAQAAPDPDKGALASANEACTRVPCDP